MRRGASWIWSSVLMAACMAPPDAGAADAAVGGQGPRVRLPEQPRPEAPPRPVFVVVDELAGFGSSGAAEAPSLVIQVEGDVELFVLPDGRLQIVLDEDRDE